MHRRARASPHTQRSEHFRPQSSMSCMSIYPWYPLPARTSYWPQWWADAPAMRDSTPDGFNSPALAERIHTASYDNEAGGMVYNVGAHASEHGGAHVRRSMRQSGNPASFPISRLTAMDNSSRLHASIASLGERVPLRARQVGEAAPIGYSRCPSLSHQGAVCQDLSTAFFSEA